MHAASQYSPLTLAYMGDAAYEILVRKKLIDETPMPAGALNRRAESFVSAVAQSKACDGVLPLLSEEEISIFMRGRNANPTNIPKNTARVDYHKATALETLFGYLYLSGQTERLYELFEVTFKTLCE